MHADDGEDDRSVAAHTAAMQHQIARVNSCDWDWYMVSDRMVRTHNSRREMINARAKTSDVLEKYPAFKDHRQVCYLMTAITKFCQVFRSISNCDTFLVTENISAN